jgi:signal transduction histidine kinase
MSALEIVLLSALLALLGVGIGLARQLRTLRRQMSGAFGGRAEALAQAQELEQRLQAGRMFLDALGEATSDALLLLDGARQVTWANRAAWNLFNRGEPEFGQPFIALVHDYELNQAVGDAMAGHRAMVRQTAVADKTLRIWAVPVDGAGGAAVSIEDVTELQRLGRARREFVANISHELRTPLANIDLAAQTLQSGQTSDPAVTGGCWTRSRRKCKR